MLRRILTSLILVCTLVILGFFSVSEVSAHGVPTPHSHVSAQALRPLSCPSPVAGTNDVATGSTSANVNMTIWKDCNGLIFASANSFRDANGFAFTGWVAIVDTNGVYHKSTCSSSGVCNSPHVTATVNDINVYQTTNGIFYYLDGVHYASGLTSFGTVYVG